MKHSGGARRLSGLRYINRLALAVLVLAPALGAQARPAAAFSAYGGPGPMPNSLVYYTVDPNFTGNGFMMEALWKGEQAWKIQGLAQQGEFWNANLNNATRRVVRVWVSATITPAIPSCDGPNGRNVACVTHLGCRDNNDDCAMTFERNNTSPWNTTTEPREGWNDVWGVAAHEFGHWHGCAHSDAQPATDPNDATMETSGDMYWEGHLPMRTIQADDISCLRASRPTANRNILANGHFEYVDGHIGGFQHLGWDWDGLVAPERKCPTAGGCYISVSGDMPSGSSIHQDLPQVWGWWQTGAGCCAEGHSLTARLRVSYRSPYSPPSAARIAVVQDQYVTIDGSPSVITLAQQACTPTGVWVDCSTPEFDMGPTGAQNMRVVITNLAQGTVLDIDHVRLTF